MTANRTKKIYLHLFSNGSGEHLLHSYLSKYRTNKNYVYKNTQFDMVYGLKSHIYLQQLIWHQKNYKCNHDSYYYINIIKFWLNIKSDFEENNNIILSLKYHSMWWDIFWETASKILDFSEIQIYPILTLCHQEDSLEYFYRYNIWHHRAENVFIPDEKKYDYSYIYNDIIECANQYNIILNSPKVYWNIKSDINDNDIIDFVLKECNSLIVNKNFDEPILLKSYDALRFAALSLPSPFPQAFTALNINPKFCADSWKSSIHRSVLTSLLQGEKQGIFSMNPLSPASMRRRAQKIGVEGNIEICKQHLYLREIINNEPQYPASIKQENPHTLDIEDIKKCIQLLSSEQKKWILHNLNTEFIELTEEQKILKDYLSLNKDIKVYSSFPSHGVTVLTLSYNVRSYISQNIESIISQRCSIPVQHIIVDDGSDDGTQELIESYAKQYPHIKPIFIPRFPRHQCENVRTMFARCQSRYVAICDGDDYFTDPLKLQKQIDFLEKHSECSLCFHPVDVLYEDGSPSRVYPPEDLLPGGIRKFYTIKDLLYANIMQTNSVMYRWRFQEGLPEWFDPTLVPSDWYWHLLHAEQGLIGYIRDHMSVYRRHTSSLYASAEGNHVDHRKIHGMNELRTYSMLNKHFKGKYYDDFCRLAMGVFADFVHIYATSGDDSLIQQGVTICPDFGRDFLRQIKIA